MHFVKFHPEVSCLLSRGKRKYTPLRMRLLWKYKRNYFLVYHLTSPFLLYLQNYKEFEAEILDFYLSIYLLASCISALAAWLTRNLHKALSWVATSASSTDQSNPRVLRSLWITSFHMVLGLPRFRFPWVGFQRYNVLGILPGSIRNTWPNHLSRRFLIMFVSWGCLVRDLT